MSLFCVLEIWGRLDPRRGAEGHKQVLAVATGGELLRLHVVQRETGVGAGERRTPRTAPGDTERRCLV